MQPDRGGLVNERGRWCRRYRGGKATVRLVLTSTKVSALGEGLGQHRPHLVLGLDAERAAAEGAGQGDEVGVVQVGRGGAAGVGAVEVEADRAVAGVVGQHDHDRQPPRGRHRQLHAAHQHAAVADHAHHLPPRVAHRGGASRGHAPAHRSGDRREQHLRRRPGMVAIHQPGRDAGVHRHDRVRGQVAGEDGDHVAEHHPVRRGLRHPGGDGFEQPAQLGRPGAAVRCGRRGLGQRVKEQPRGAGDGEVGRVVGAELRRVGVHVDHALRRLRRGGKTVAVGGGVAQAGADGQHQVGLAQPGQLLAGVEEAELAREQPVEVGEQVVAAEACQHRQAPGLGGRQQCGPARPVRELPTGNDQRPLGPGQPVQRLGQRPGRRPTRFEPVRARCCDVHQLRQHVLRQRHHHRPRCARGRGVDCAR